jgi:signal transduction histidine kinase
VKHELSRLIDAAVLLVVGVIAVVGAGLRTDPSARPVAVMLSAAAAVVLVFRRRAPTLTLAASGGLVLALFAVDHAAGSIAVVAPAAALYSLALLRGGGHVVIGALAAATAVVIADVFFVGGHAYTLTLQTVGHAALVAVPVLAGEALRNHRANVRLLRERLELAERTREEEAQRRVEQERLRIARELHDVVAHTLTTINVQAGVARHLLERQPEHAEGALATIESASHDALQELRAILGVLREPGQETPPLEPTPKLGTVEALIQQARGGGEVHFQVLGERPDRLPEAVQLAAYRIVQESLTNSRRHAPGTAAEVTVAFDSDRLRLMIENATVNGDGSDGAGADGIGIVGMRERVLAIGGTLEASRAGDRFRVAAELPYRSAA